MKRIFAAVILLAVAVSLAVWSGITFKKEMNSLCESLNSLIQISEENNVNKLKKETQLLVDEWNRSSELLHSLVVHEGMDELEESITALPLILEHSEIDEFKSKCIEAINIIGNLTKAEKVNIGNIL